MNQVNKVLAAAAASQQTLHTFISDPVNVQMIENFATLVKLCYGLADRGLILTCGNGGSHASALHFCEELTGRFKEDREPLGALALGEAIHATCVGNDYGFEEVFSRQLRALGRKNDVLVVLSTSGNSENVIRAVEVARLRKMYVVGLLGRDGGRLIDLVDLPIVVESDDTARIQEIHMFVLHVVVDLVEQYLKRQRPGGGAPPATETIELAQRRTNVIKLTEGTGRGGFVS